MAVRIDPREYLATALIALRRYSSQRNRRIVAALCAVFAVFLTLSNPEGSGQQRSVVVAQRAISAGEVLRLTDLTTVTVSGAPLPQSLTDPVAGAGQRAAIPIPAGGLITTNQLIGPGLLDNDQYALVPLRLSDVSLSSVLSVGDWIDIFATKEGKESSLVASRVRVAALPRRTTSPGFASTSTENSVVLVAIVRSLAGMLASAGASEQLSIAIRASD